MAKECNTKICSCCKLELSIDNYNKLSCAKDKLQKYCRACQSNKNKQWHLSNKEKRAAYREVYVAATVEHRKKTKRKWDEANYEHRRRYRKARLPYYTERARMRSALKSKATPPWLTQEHILEIRQLYWLADDLFTISGQSYHVDHIVPLKGKDVCGLHVPWNLQILPSDLNLSKSNKHRDYNDTV